MAVVFWMGVTQLTLSCDRSFFANPCFIRLFSNSSIWRALRGAGVPNAGFPVYSRKGLAPNRMPEGIVHPAEIIHPITLRGGSGRGTRLVLAAPIGRQYIQYIKAGCRPVPFQILIAAADFTPGPSEIGGPERRLPVAGFRGMASAQAVQIAGNSADWNLPLAARARVGHIGLTGAVAEWLKAAVC